MLPSRMVPFWGWVTPAMTLMSVLFPDPLVPNTRLTCPSKSSETSSSAKVDPKCFEMPLTAMFVALFYLDLRGGFLRRLQATPNPRRSRATPGTTYTR